MKAIHTLLIICLFGCFTACNGQAKVENKQKQSLATSKKKDSTKPMNLIDEQTKILGGLFSTLDTGNEANPFAGSKNYLEVVDKMDAPEETKKYLREQYKLYSLSLDPTKKDSLGAMVDKMLQKALDESKNSPNN